MVTFEQIRDHIPQYLTPKQQRELVDQLRDFENQNYYTTLYQAEMLQGDGWTKIEVVSFETGARDKIKGILLSNSCDIAPVHPRDFPPRIVFAPLISLQDFTDLLKRSPSLKPEQIESKVASIRKQLVTSLFYLPRGGGLDNDYIAVLDNLHSVPLQKFLQEPERVKL